MTEMENAFPYFNAHRRIFSLLTERSPYMVHEKKLSQMDEKELFGLLKQVDKKIAELNKCMAIHSRRIIEKQSLSHMTYHIVSFTVEAEMKHRLLEYRRKIKEKLRSQKRLTKFL